MDEIEYEGTQTLEKVEQVTATFAITLDYTQSVNELLEDGALASKDDVENYILECLAEDISMHIGGPFFLKRHTIVEIMEGENHEPR